MLNKRQLKARRKQFDKGIAALREVIRDYLKGGIYSVEPFTRTEKVEITFRTARIRIWIEDRDIEIQNIPIGVIFGEWPKEI